MDNDKTTGGTGDYKPDESMVMMYGVPGLIPNPDPPWRLPHTSTAYPVFTDPNCELLKENKQLKKENKALHRKILKLLDRVLKLLEES